MSQTKLPINFTQPVTTVTRAPGSKGATIDIVALHPDDAKTFRPPSLDTEREAAEVLEALFELPAETRRELYRLMVEAGEGFCAAPRPKAKSHKFPPTPRGHR